MRLSGMELKVSDASPGSKKPPLSLKGDVEFDASPQAIRFTLAADQVNLDRYLPPPREGAGRRSARRLRRSRKSRSTFLR